MAGPPIDVDIVLADLQAGRDLARGTCEGLFAELFAGRVNQPRMERLLLAFARKSETIDELAAAAAEMRRHVTPIRCSDSAAIDTCGTGGDGVSTLNTSTAAAIVAAAAGATVAKHGNRSNTRASGSTEVLTVLGIDVDAEPPRVEQALRDARIGYLNAARLHPAMHHVAAARRAVGIRTIFNLLGPLTNPAGVRRQLLGVPRPELTTRLAEVLRELGSEHVMVVHGCDGLCDLTVTGPSLVAELRNGRVRTHELRPETLGLATGPRTSLLVSGPQESAERILAVLRGERGPRRDHVLMNAAAALFVAGRAPTLAAGVVQAASAIDSGAAMQTLERWRAIQGTGAAT